MDLLKKAIEAAIVSGRKIHELYKTAEVHATSKEDLTPLTNADLLSNKIIIARLEDTGIPIMSEENKTVPFNVRKKWKRLWIIDPLDGTKEFLKENGEFTVNIALIENNKPLLGVIYVPVTGELYYGDKENGSYKTVIEDIQSPAHITTEPDPLPCSYPGNDYTMVVSRSHMNDATRAYIDSVAKTKAKIRTITRGSSLKICMVAEGKADCYPRFAPTMEWDTAAGHAIAVFAGKKVLSADTGEELSYNKEILLNPWFIVR